MTRNAVAVAAISAMLCITGCKKSEAELAAEGEKLTNRGFDLVLGKSGTRDPVKGLALAEKACTEDNFIKGCMLAGMILGDPATETFKAAPEVEPNYRKAYEYLSKACGNPDAPTEVNSCGALAVGLLEPLRVPENDSLRMKIRKSLCSLGHKSQCNPVHWTYFRPDGLPDDPEKARAEATAAAPKCSNGDAYECFRLGGLIARGVGVEWDLARAARAFENACAAGHKKACNNIGYMTYFAAGVPFDAQKVVDYVERGAERKQGDEPILNNPLNHNLIVAMGTAMQGEDLRLQAVFARRAAQDGEKK